MTDLRESLVSDKPPFSSLLLIMAIIFIGFMVVGPMIGIGLGMAIYGADIMTEIASGTANQELFYPLLLIQGTASFIGLVVLPMCYVRFNEQKPIAAFFKKDINLPATIGIICLIGICFIITISPIAEWNMTFEFPEFLKGFGDWAREKEDMLAEMTKVLTHFKSFGGFLVALLVIAVIPGIGEEFVFRGLVQNELWRSSRNIHIAIWVSAFLFSAFHIQFFGFFPRLLLGALFGYMYYWSGNLWIPMIAHFFNNGFALTMIYLHGAGVHDIDMEKETAAPISLIAVCAVAVFALLYFFKKRYSAPPETL